MRRRNKPNFDPCNRQYIHCALVRKDRSAWLRWSSRFPCFRSTQGYCQDTIQGYFSSSFHASVLYGRRFHDECHFLSTSSSRPLPLYSNEDLRSFLRCTRASPSRFLSHTRYPTYSSQCFPLSLSALPVLFIFERDGVIIDRAALFDQ